MAKAKAKFIGCSARILPEDEQIAAAKAAISINPVNRVNAPLSFDLDKIDKFAIAVMTTKYWGSSGVHLSVGFLSNASAALQDKILSHMNAWGQVCNAAFSIASGTPSRAQVRISLGAGGYWSYLGTDVGQIPLGQPTMNLQGFSLNTPESEYRRVVRHETGHTLGCVHEHLRGELVARLNPQKTISYFEQTQGWSAQEVQQQVLTPVSESSLMGTAHAEEDSVMCYQLPGSITIDGKPIIGGVDITANDGAFMGKIYPKSIIPPPPPASGKVRLVVDVDATGKTASVISVS